MNGRRSKAARLYKLVARGTVAKADMKISAVDGTAFLDFSAANILTTKIGDLIKVRDSAGRLIQGYPKAAGTGETLGSELVDAWTNNAIYPFETWTPGAGNLITQAINTGGGFGFAEKVIAPSVGALYKEVATIALASGISPSVTWGLDKGSTKTQFATGSTTGTYRTIPSAAYNNIYIGSLNNATDFAVSDFSLKQVLTPSATGVTISSTKGGSTMNWATKDAAFNYNDPSGYTYEIYRVLQAPVVSTNNVLAGNALIDATDANAFAAPVGVDLSPYQDGRHILAMYDASGYAALAWISATAPSGEALGSELLSNPSFDANTNGWLAVNATLASVAGGQSGNCLEITMTGGTYQAAFVPSIFTLSKLYKASTYVKSGTSGNEAATIMSNNTNIKKQTTTAAWVNIAGYITPRGTDQNVYLIKETSTAGTMLFDEVSAKQVTMPAATGALLLSTKGGSRGWIYKHPNFNPNAAITAKILFVGD